MLPSGRPASSSCVLVGQVRRGQPLDLVGGRDLEHPEHAQHIRAQPVRRSRLVRLALARHQARPPAVRVRPPAGRRPPAAEGTGPPNPMISSPTDNSFNSFNSFRVRSRDEGCDDPGQSREAVVTCKNARCAGGWHGSGIGSGSGSDGGRSTPGLSQHPGRRARPGRTAGSWRRVRPQDPERTRRREGAAWPGTGGVGTVSSRFSGTKAGVGGCSSVPRASSACGTDATLRDHP